MLLIELALNSEHPIKVTMAHVHLSQSVCLLDYMLLHYSTTIIDSFPASGRMETRPLPFQASWHDCGFFFHCDATKSGLEHVNLSDAIVADGVIL